MLASERFPFTQGNKGLHVASYPSNNITDHSLRLAPRNQSNETQTALHLVRSLVDD